MRSVSKKARLKKLKKGNMAMSLKKGRQVTKTSFVEEDQLIEMVVDDGRARE